MLFLLCHKVGQTLLDQSALACVNLYATHYQNSLSSDLTEHQLPCVLRIPDIATGKAAWIVHAEHRTTLRASPFNIFVLDKILNADLLDACQIVQDTCPIFGSIAFIQIFQARAGIFSALVTEFEVALHQPVTVLDLAGQTGFHFQSVVTATTRTGILVPCVGTTEAAINSARGDQGWIG
jgi:hypothetical protein